MAMSVEDSAEASKKLGIYIAACSALSDGIDRGGLTDEERASLAERFGVSEALLLRCERASQAYRSVIGEEQCRQARREALRNVEARGKEIFSEEYWEDRSKAIERIADSVPEQEIVRESRAAHNALMVALGVPPAWDLQIDPSPALQSPAPTRSPT